MEHDKTNYLLLPVSTISRIDVGRLLRELESLDNFLRQSVIRDPNAKITLPRSTLLFEDIVAVNKLNMLQEKDRTRLIDFLRSVKSQAPLLHISFSADPSPLFLKRLVGWLRQEIHPLALIQLGLQPNIGAGCVIRTTNKYFDFSLRQHFNAKRDQLILSLHGTASTQMTPTPNVKENVAAS